MTDTTGHLVGAEHQAYGQASSHPYSQCKERGCDPIADSVKRAEDYHAKALQIWMDAQHALRTAKIAEHDAELSFYQAAARLRDAQKAAK